MVGWDTIDKRENEMELKIPKSNKEIPCDIIGSEITPCSLATDE